MNYWNVKLGTVTIILYVPDVGNNLQLQGKIRICFTQLDWCLLKLQQDPKTSHTNPEFVTQNLFSKPHQSIKESNSIYIYKTKFHNFELWIEIKGALKI